MLLIRQTTFEQVQLRTSDFQNTQSLQNLVNKNKHSMAQSTHLMNQSPNINHLQNTATQAGHLFISRTVPSVMGLFNQQQSLQRDENTYF